ncbi:MAG: dihydroorotate dehydrogenase electron transfer subunit [Marinilabiliales bacterium]|nr:MAG: dihydroorotate dehydrogenase electron transfer subunit [Marinilabiliales bacterium]
MKKYIQDFKVVRNKRLNADNYLLEIKCLENLPEVFPGQFAEVLIENSRNVFLRRPFSIHDADPDSNTLKLLIKRVGEGTRNLGYLEEGDFVNLVYPLGNYFSLPEGENALLIGGGCGVAPLLYLARYLSEYQYFPTMLVGAKTANDILEADEYQKYGNLLVATEDGSLGEKGLVTQHFEMHNIANYSKVYVCGPKPMMQAVAKMAADAGVECEVSLENTMACGIGACLCCVEETVHGNACTCTDGPVFNLNDLKW